LGCNGGDMGEAFKYAIKYGMMQSKDYPYTAVDGICHYNSSEVVVKPRGYINVQPNNAKALKNAIATAPVSVAIEADTFVF